MRHRAYQFPIYLISLLIVYTLKPLTNKESHMPYELYKIIHLAGLFLLISGLITAFTITSNGHALAGKAKTFSFALHGLGLVLVLVSGFGLLARLGLAREMPVWAYVKFGIWGVFALYISVIKRKGQIGWPLFASMFSVFLVAAYLAIYKPF